MAAPFSSTQLRVPRGLAGLLEGLCTAVLRDQPQDILPYAASYCDALIATREDTGSDPVVVSALLEDRYYNNRTFAAAEKRYAGEFYTKRSPRGEPRVATHSSDADTAARSDSDDDVKLASLPSPRPPPGCEPPDAPGEATTGEEGADDGATVGGRAASPWDGAVATGIAAAARGLGELELEEEEEGEGEREEECGDGITAFDEIIAQSVHGYAAAMADGDLGDGGDDDDDGGGGNDDDGGVRAKDAGGFAEDGGDFEGFVEEEEEEEGDGGLSSLEESKFLAESGGDVASGEREGGTGEGIDVENKGGTFMQSIDVAGSIDVDEDDVIARSINVAASVDAGEDDVIARSVDVAASVDAGEDDVIARSVDVAASVEAGEDDVIARSVDVAGSVDVGEDDVIARSVDVAGSVDVGEDDVITQSIDVRRSISAREDDVIKQSVDVMGSAEMDEYDVITQNIDVTGSISAREDDVITQSVDVPESVSVDEGDVIARSVDAAEEPRDMERAAADGGGDGDSDGDADGDADGGGDKEEERRQRTPVDVTAVIASARSEIGEAHAAAALPAEDIAATWREADEGPVSGARGHGVTGDAGDGDDDDDDAAAGASDGIDARDGGVSREGSREFHEGGDGGRGDVDGGVDVADRQEAEEPSGHVFEE
ncbi:sperm surface protein Sp17 [Petromyzon marinus]|uniref:Sperm surface protein Sp17 n=1 Tax=Petromyzon marinus TaxID=7757 RepID=A0AAJ7X3T3_PETMA|nr:sperm surface protein Sp17 [Petromyzon marinus]